MKNLASLVKIYAGFLKRIGKIILSRGKTVQYLQIEKFINTPPQAQCFTAVISGTHHSEK